MMKKYLNARNIIFALFSGAVCFVVFGVGSFGKTPNLEYAASTAATENIMAPEAPKPAHIKTPDKVRGIYMTNWVASTKDWRESLVGMIDSTELNAVVIDVKDYTGVIPFEVENSELQRMNSVENRIPDIKEFINYLHSKNIYVIARISVFQDMSLSKKRPDLAVKKGDGVTVWKDRKGISWLDPCSIKAWEYTAMVAREAERVGFDELNFDYIRFASDGNMKDIKYTFCEDGVSKQDALENFFVYLRKELDALDVPLSADLFGMTTTNTDDLNIGQVLEKAAPHFDYICPMVYPSHYPPTYNGFKNPALYPYEVVKLAMYTAARRLINQELGFAPSATSTSAISASDSLWAGKLRPWLQDFDLGATYDAPMVRKQMQAVYDVGLDSWLLWDPANKYTRDALDR